MVWNPHTNLLKWINFYTFPIGVYDSTKNQVEENYEDLQSEMLHEKKL
jgi:hypothetical protein